MARRIVVALALLASLTTAAAQQPRTVTVELLAINDLHGNLDPPAGAVGRINQTPAGGAEYLATHLAMAERDNPNWILVGAGDLIGASPLVSGLFADRPTIEAVNAMHLSVTSIGNHELDKGSAHLLAEVHGACPAAEGCQPGEHFTGARFQYLAANVDVTAHPGQTLFPATAIRTVGGVRIGFIGETLENTPAVTATKAVEGLRFLEESAVANAAAARLERQGVHTIVLLIHQGGGQRSSNADPNGCDNFGGEIKGIVEKLSPVIKVVISGHTHQFYNCQIAGHTVTSAASYGRMFTRVNLTIDRRTDALVNVAATNEIVTRDVAKDPAQTAILNRYRARADAIANQPVGSITADILRKPNPAGESPLGDIIADAQLASVSAPGVTGSDKGGAAVIAFMNDGGIRAELSAPAGSPAARPVTFGDLYAIQPFANVVTVRTLTGDMLRRLLEQQWAGPHGGDILQVSAGFTYEYRSDAPAGQHIVPGSIKLNGKPIGLTDKLRVEESDFLSTGGDGFTVFREGTDPIVGPVDIDALVAWFRTHSPVAPGPQNRIIRVD